MLPPFTAEGLLPPGDYELTIEDIRQSHLVLGCGQLGWDVQWRRRLVTNLSNLVHQLWEVGICQIYIDGSFVEDKNHPNDIDGYFICERDQIRTGSLLLELNRLDPVWTWARSSRRTERHHPKPQLPMWHEYRVELFPHYGQKCGILDADGFELDFPSAFRHSRQGHALKGIVKLKGGR